jgi:hypothetical protein
VTGVQTVLFRSINVKVEGNAINAYMSPRSMVVLQINK